MVVKKELMLGDRRQASFAICCETVSELGNHYEASSEVAEM